MEPIEEAISLLQERQEQAPALVEAIRQADHETQIKLIQMLQDALGQERLAAPVQELLAKQVRRAAPINIVGHLWDLQTDENLLHRQAERLHRMKSVLARYLVDTGISEYLPVQSQGWYQEFSGFNDSRHLIKFFHHWYPFWLDLQFAINDGFISSEIDAFQWLKNKQRKRNVIRSIRRWFTLHNLPPITRNHADLDPEYQIDAFAPRQQGLVLRSES